MGVFPAAALRRTAAAFDGRMGWHLEDLATGQVHQYRADERFPTASVIKIAVLVELFHQAEVGRLSLDDRHRLRGNISTHGSGVLQIARDEPELTLRDYARLMMGISDNIATDFLMGLLGLDQINATLDRLGCANVRAAATMGRYHYRMVGMDEMPTNRANDAVYRERVSTRGLDYGSVSFGDSLANNVAAPGELASLLAAMYRRTGRQCSGIQSHDRVAQNRAGYPHDPALPKAGCGGGAQVRLQRYHQRGCWPRVFANRALGRGGLCPSPQRRARCCRGHCPGHPLGRGGAGS